MIAKLLICHAGWSGRACGLIRPLPRPIGRPRFMNVTSRPQSTGKFLAARAAEGTRNDTLHRAAVKLGTLVGAGKLSRAAAETELQRAGQAAGLPPREC